jgi:hypothetical protein
MELTLGQFGDERLEKGGSSCLRLVAYGGKGVSVRQLASARDPTSPKSARLARGHSLRAKPPRQKMQHAIAGLSLLSLLQRLAYRLFQGR